MSEEVQEPQAPSGGLVLNVGDRSFDFGVVGKAVAFARDFVLAEDIKNAAKNVGTVKLSPLSEALDEALAILQEVASLGVPDSDVVEGSVVENAEPEPATA